MTPPRLSNFIRLNIELILQAWENFARTVEPPALVMDDTELRDHAQLMLLAIADDLDTPQSDRERIVKSEGKATCAEADTAAEQHAEARLLAGYTAVQLVSEYRALRSSVLSLWMKDQLSGLPTQMGDMIRFNEGVDQALAESVARYEKLVNESRDMFLAILGHDLRNPLSAVVSGSTHIMRAGDVPPKYVLTATRMFNSARRMSSLVNDLIEFTRTHLGAGIPIQPKNADIVKLCSEAVEELRSAQPGRAIVVNAPDVLTAFLDDARVAQMISNLIGNALQYGDPSTPIAVDIKDDGKAVILEFNNQGEPIPADKISRIFDPLVRLEKKSVSPGGSLGIGLFIARETAIAHGGEIGVTSNVKDGTTFSVKIPLHKK